MIRVFTFMFCMIFAINCSTENNPTSSDDDTENTPIYKLSITVSPQEGGSVISDPNQDAAEKGTAFTLTATPNDGYYFVGWAGDNTTNENPIKFNLDRDKVIIAEFALDRFYMAENGITVLCPSASNNETGMIEGIEYTKRVELMSISASNAESTCFDPRYEMAKGQSGFWNNIDKSFNSPVNHWDVKGVRLMDYLFKDMVDFDQPLSAWDVSAVENFSGIFMSAESFNQDIGDWDVSNVIYMMNMFNGATNFNQDLSEWCVSNITTEPTGFATNSGLTEENKPKWGTCPGG